MSKKIRNILIISFTIMLLVGFGIVVYGKNTDMGGNNGGGHSTGDSEGGNAPGWNGRLDDGVDNNRDRIITNGLRVSLVTSAKGSSENKNLVSKDYVYTRSAVSSRNAKRNDKMISRPAMYSVNFNKRITKDNNPLLSLSSLSKLFDFEVEHNGKKYDITLQTKGQIEDKFAKGTEFGDINEIFHLDNLLVDYCQGKRDSGLKDLCKNKNKIAKAFFENILRKMELSPNLEKYREDNLYNLFVVIEPTTLIYDGKNQYYGTFYELAHVYKNGNSNMQNILGNVIRKNMACSIHFDSSLKKHLVDNKITASWLSNFKNGKYFGNISLNDVNNKCSKGTLFSNSELTSKGIGIGLLWVSNYIDAASPNCSDVVKYYKNKGTNLTTMTYHQISNFNFYEWNKEHKFQQIYPDWYLENEDKNCIYEQPTCQDINKFYGETLKNRKCNDILKKDFAEWNNRYPNNKIDGKWYQKNCGCVPNPGQTSTSCDPIIENNSCLGNTNNLAFKYKDGEIGSIDFWNDCVYEDKGTYTVDYHKQSESGEFRYFEFTDPCSLYCTEEVEVVLPKSPSIPIKSGSNFVWGQGRVTGRKICKAKPFSISNFEKKVSDNNKKMMESYIYYKLYKEVAEVVTDSKKLEKYKTSNNMFIYDKDKGFYTTDCIPIKNGETIDDKKGRVCTTKGYYKVRVSNGLTGDNMERIWEETWPVLEKGMSIPKVESRQRPEITIPEEMKKRKKDYDTAVKVASTLEVKTNRCDKNGLGKEKVESLYNFKPEVMLEYSDLSYTRNQIKLVGDITSEVEERLPKETGTHKFNISVECNKNGCRKKEVEVKLFDRVYRAEVTKEAHLSLPPKLYQAILKKDALSVDLGDSRLSNDNYTLVGYPNLPVAFKTESGTYGEYNGRGKLNISYKNIGHIYGSSSFVDKINEEQKNEKYGNWKCEYEVIKEPTIHGLIKVIYREIDLKNPFPDIDGTGRHTGSNWCATGDCSNKNKVVDDVILNNRNVKDFDIYKGEPMYSFILTPKMISQIKKHNKDFTYYDYSKPIVKTNKSGFWSGYECDDNGKTCISGFFSSLLEKTQAKGTCVTERNFRDSNAFNKCRYNN